MSDALLVVNSGSSSLKLSLHDAYTSARLVKINAEALASRARLSALDERGLPVYEHRWDRPVDQDEALTFARKWLSRKHPDMRIVAVGHRVVHGGMRNTEPRRVDLALLTELEELVPLAPLHQPQNLAPMRMFASTEPALPQVACFDTAFHRSQPAVAQAFALPGRITGLGVLRYGFHGLSYEYIASVLKDHDPVAAAGRCIVLHLGAGSSACALAGGRSVASTMGFSTLDGLPMGTRCGSLDPGVILYLLQQQGMSADEISQMLYRDSGLKGVSGISADVRDLLEVESTEPGARAALALYAYRIGREIGSLVAALGGLDALVFTAGVGEHAVRIRSDVCAACSWLGLRLDVAANQTHGPRISAANSRVNAWVIPTDEEGLIAIQAKEVLSR